MVRAFVLTVVAAAISAMAPVASGEPLDDVVDAYEAFVRAHDPAAAARHDRRPPDAWASVARADVEARSAEAAELLERLNDSDGGDFVTRAILETLLVQESRRAAEDLHRIPFTGDWGFQIEPVFAVSRTRLSSLEDAEALVRRIDAVSILFAQNIENMRRGLETGFVAHEDPLNTVLEQVREQIVEDPAESGLFEPFERLPQSISEDDARKLRSAALDATARAVEAYEGLLSFLEEDYAPNARAKPGLSSLPSGRDLYQAAVAVHTTRADLTPDDVHAIGQAEVARIRAEMEAVIAETGFEDGFEAFLIYLRTEPEFYARTPEELLAKAAALSKRLDAILPQYFGRLPRLTYGVSPVPAAIAPGYTTARYAPGDPDQGQAGTYLVNTYRLDQRPLYELPALTAHEAVPGHHLQIALAQELRDAPQFRRSYYATAFGEGWALYAERIAGEAGLYETPYEQFGALSYEMWRACRLVADTGLHWLGWSRAEAEACFRENTALAPLNIETEVTRYIGWPGQALGYKIGEITIRELRAEAEAELGDDFDVRAFHDVVLAAGATPLDVLEARVRDWVAELAPQ